MGTGERVQEDIYIISGCSFHLHYLTLSAFSLLTFVSRQRA